MCFPTIVSNVLAVLVDVCELAQRLDDKDVLLGPCNHHFGSLVQNVVHNLQCLEDVTPVLALIVQSLVEHVHDLVELGTSAVGTTSH